MDGSPARQGARPAYSVSSLMVYEACPFQYYYTAVLGLPPPRTAAMARGTSVHKLIADHYRKPELLPPDAEPEVLELFERFRSSRFNVPPVASERRFTLPLGGGDVRGRIDLVLPQGDGLELVDFKSGWMPEAEVLGRSLQLPLYTLAAADLFGCAPEDLSYTYYYLRSDSEASFPSSPEAFAETRERVEGLLDAIGRKRFAPLPGCTCFACTSGRSRVQAARRRLLQQA